MTLHLFDSYSHYYVYWRYYESKRGKNRYLETETEEEGWTCVGGQSGGEDGDGVIFAWYPGLSSLPLLFNDEN